MVATSAFTYGSRAQITALALKYRLPANGAAGDLMSCVPSDTEYDRQAAGFVDGLFKGAKVAELPIEQRTEFEPVINLKTAKAFGLVVPQVSLPQAERVIEQGPVDLASVKRSG